MDDDRDDRQAGRWMRGRGPSLLIWVLALLATTISAIEVWRQGGLGL